ncbi:MAG TPA: ATP-dependent DNA helicase RecG, partial [Candidatus Omnitrophota bacterium]|nr:ATP-dependent DNA helicase RecG [Candidatus Omnitrophota bacterium]
RLSVEEFLLFQLPPVLRKASMQEKPVLAHRVEGSLLETFLSGLSFHLTASQRQVLQEIKQDMAAQHPMQRLLQGDVGSGKTVVATAACVVAIQGGYQAAFMVPTEILARQHYDKIIRQFASLRQRGKPVRVEVLTSSVSAKEKQAVSDAIEAGTVHLVIGTHALLDETLRFKRLGLVVIDEQHKFGVGQRALLPQKGPSPDVLIMTATPIPRTLAITLYGDMDSSVINELPPGRSPVTTMHFSRDFKFQAYEMAKQQIAQGNQVYIVYPVIEESYALDIDGAKKMYEEFREGEFRGFRLGLIHGKLSQKEQEQIMKGFTSGEIDLLVSTTILEVGIDVPDATCMIIEHAERFGLSQLHQLRGRVGRGTRQSMCLLISDTTTPESQARVKAMVEHSSGFEIAQEDLKIRGPGEFFGRRQHGLTELRIGNPLTQMHLLKRAREEAIRLVNADPGLQQRQHLLLKERLVQRFPEYERLMLVG